MTRKFKIISISFFIVIVNALAVYLFVEDTTFKGKHTDKIVSGKKYQYPSDIDSLVRSNSPRAEARLNELFQIAAQKKDTLWLTYAYYYKIILSKKNENRTGAYDSIPFFIEKALLYAEKSPHDLFIKGALHYQAGGHYIEKKNFAKSIEHLLKAQNDFETTDYKQAKAYVFNQLGKLYSNFDETDKASFYLEKSYELLKELNDSLGIASYYLSMSRICLQKGEGVCEKIKEGLRASIKIFEENHYPSQAVQVTLALGDIELNSGNIPLAKTYMDEAYQKAVSMQDTIIQRHILLHYGGWYEARQDYPNAMAFYKEGLKLPNNYIDSEALQRLSDLYVQKGDYKEANQYLTRYYQLTDSLTGVKVKSQIDEIQWKNEIQHQEYKNQLLQSQYEIVQQKNKNQTKVYVIIFIVGVAVLGLIGVLYKSNKKTLLISRLKNDSLEKEVSRQKREKVWLQKQFDYEMELKNRELTAINMQLLSKNTFLREVEKIIKEEEEASIDSKEKKFKSFLHKLNSQEKDWEQFKKVFEKVHPAFFDTIKKNYPQFSKSEIRICTYMKINMDIHEIATMLNIGQRSLITIRSRIRKKIKLDTHQDLDEFIRTW